VPTVPAWVGPTTPGGVDPSAPALAAAAAYTQARRPDLDYRDDAPAQDAPTADVVMGTRILAARLDARKGAALGVQGFGDIVGTIARQDPDVTRLLSIGAHTLPAIG
jgi:hypothetical protein